MPVLADLEAELVVTEGDGPTLIDGDVSVSDAEQDWEFGLLVVSGKAPGDIVGLLNGGQITLDVFDVIYAGQVIGDWMIGPDGEFVVRFNANATNAGVEAVVESLTFQSTGDDPAYYRNLSLTLVDAAGNASTVGDALFPQTGAANPFDGVDFDSTTHIALGDIDNDGDLDAIVTVYDDGFHLFRNDGTAQAANFVQDDAALSLTGTLGNSAGVTLADVDGDGFVDLVVGRYNGTLNFFEGNGAFGFTEQTGAANPFDGIDHYSSASPGMADLNGDGFLDLVTGGQNGRFYYFEGGAGGFTEQTGGANPLDAFMNYGGGNTVSFADVDGDGDYDLIRGAAEGSVVLFENTGTASAPVFAPDADSPYTSGSFQLGMQPVLVDIDADGDYDLVATNSQGQIEVSLLGPASPSIDVNVDGVDDVATVVDETPSGDADGPIVVNLLSNDSDVDNALGIANAEIDGTPLVIDDITTLAGGTKITILGDGSVTIDPGKTAQQLGAAGSGATNTSLTYVLTYTLTGGETGTATFTINGVDDKDILTGTIGFDTIHAGVGNDVVSGLDGIDMLYGEDGNDTLNGGDGDDSLYGGAGADKLWGGDGIDALFSDAGPGYLYGEAGVDYLNGGDDNDYLDGGSGDDFLAGGAGNDVYIVDSAGDAVTENTNAGYDIIRSTISIAVLVDNVEAVQLQGSADLNADGNGLANNLQGNAGSNILSGLAGVDTINGADGDDVIAGGTGNDLLRGGLGADRFVVFQESVGGSALETDQIYDFSAAEGDVLDLSFIDAKTGGADDAFTYVGATFGKHAGEMTMSFAGGVTTVKLDVNGDGRADYQVKINGDVTGESGDWLL
jgi:Ca2+-binding RTX toxin-like protein